ncbi:murein biosynthesis integral membrane protein MurJ [Methylomonas sp. MK1]|uniref:murein biosynthesis integral membrane protein MurJ n=1 Tax=Methylomonas sp. MK1 TaxID=1131552 RepID=UPI00039DD6A0|nr:murein biosynthesis integral membrane protein MurJ [Methylomonas sp. MK1]
MSKQLFKSTAIVSSMTMISRIMGFVRDMLFANIFGVNAATDAFFVAFRIPNFLRRLFMEGAFAQAFVPTLADYNEKGSREALQLFIDRTAGTLAVLLMLFTVAGVIAAPLLILLFAPGFLWEGGQYELAVQMLRITFPYLFFVTLVAFAGAILNAHGKFAIPALTPVFLNICMIGAAVWISPLMEQPIMALAWGVFAAGVVQLLFQIPALARLRLLPRPRWGYQDPAVKRMLKQMLPAIFGVSVVQVNLLFGTLVASFLTSGSVSWLYYSDRLVEFPLGILGVALATVILPRLSENHAADDAMAFSKALDWGLKLVLLIGLPATLGLTLLAEPLLSTLFQYNEFGSDDVRMSGKSLMAYALGLLAFMLIKILVPGFTSRQDTQTPMRFGMYSIVANIVLSLLLAFPFAHAGIALATTLSAYLNALLLLLRLLKTRTYRPSEQWLSYILRIVAANAVMSGFLYYFVDATLWLDWNASQRGLHLGMTIGLAILIYSLTLVLLGIRPRHIGLQKSVTT